MSYWEFYDSRDIKKTRKYHRCCHCKLDIPKGVSCFYESGKFDGDFISQYAHNECAKKYLELNRYSECGEMWIALDEMREVYPHESFSEWQRKIADKYNVLDGDGL